MVAGRAEKEEEGVRPKCWIMDSETADRWTSSISEGDDVGQECSIDLLPCVHITRCNAHSLMPSAHVRIFR